MEKSRKCGKEGKKLQKFEYLKNENRNKEIENEIKNTFHSFRRAVIWWKNKNLIKKADTSFNIYLY